MSLRLPVKKRQADMESPPNLRLTRLTASHPRCSKRARRHAGGMGFSMPLVVAVALFHLEPKPLLGVRTPGAPPFIDRPTALRFYLKRHRANAI